MVADITLETSPLAVDLPTTLVSEVNALEGRGQALTKFARSGFQTAAVCAVFTGAWWWFQGQNDPHFTWVDLPSTLTALKENAQQAATQIGFSDPFDAFYHRATSILSGPVPRYMATFAIVGGALKLLFSKDWKGSLMVVLGGFTILGSTWFMSTIEEKGLFGAPQELTITQLLHKEDWAGATKLLEEDDSDVGVYAKAQIAFLAKDKNALVKELDAFESMDLSPPKWVQMSRLFAMEEAAYGHAVSEFAQQWQVEHADFVVERGKTIKNLFLTEAGATIGFGGILALGLWLRRRAAKIKALASPFTSVFQPNETLKEEGEKHLAPSAPSGIVCEEIIERDEDNPITDLALSYALGVPTNLTPAAIAGAELSNFEPAEHRSGAGASQAVVDDGANGDDGGNHEINADTHSDYSDPGSSDFGGGGD